MFKKWRLTDRTRTLLTLEIAIVLPAAALMGFSIWNLKHLQRSGGCRSGHPARTFTRAEDCGKENLAQGDRLDHCLSVPTFPNPDEDRASIKASWNTCCLEHPEFAYAMSL